MNLSPDILIVGGGNAALCAAITAAETGARIVMLETAPKPYRGGNSRHTRNFRCMHQGAMGVLSDAYAEDEFFDDLLKVTAGNTDETLARMVIQNSEKCYDWMNDHGVRFQPSLSGTLSLSRTNAFFLGGGKALVNAYYRRAAELGIEVHYQANVTHLHRDGDRITEVRAQINDHEQVFNPRAVVVASGGFQANLDWLEEAWGPAARNFTVRGTEYAQGGILRSHAP